MPPASNYAHSLSNLLANAGDQVLADRVAGIESELAAALARVASLERENADLKETLRAVRATADNALSRPVLLPMGRPGKVFDMTSKGHS